MQREHVPVGERRRAPKGAAIAFLGLITLLEGCAVDNPFNGSNDNMPTPAPVVFYTPTPTETGPGAPPIQFQTPSPSPAYTLTPEPSNTATPAEPTEEPSPTPTETATTTPTETPTMTPPTPTGTPTQTNRQEVEAGGANAFSDYRNASGDIVFLGAGTIAIADCLIYDPNTTVTSTGGLWYRLDMPTGFYDETIYAPANTFENPDPTGQNRALAYDPALAVCPDSPSQTPPPEG